MTESPVHLDTFPATTATLSQNDITTTHETAYTVMDPVPSQPMTAYTMTSQEPTLETTNISTADASVPVQVPTPAHSSTPAPMPSTASLTQSHVMPVDSVAIGPSTDDTTIISSDTTSEAVCVITLLLTTGARHPYRLDEKYLTKRNVSVPGLTEDGKKDPFSISVYTLKELILREWRDEWDARPSSPSSIRLIHFGRLLDDKTPLKGTCHKLILFHHAGL